jgi:hypothetical protein
MARSLEDMPRLHAWPAAAAAIAIAIAMLTACGSSPSPSQPESAATSRPTPVTSAPDIEADDPPITAGDAATDADVELVAGVIAFAAEPSDDTFADVPFVSDGVRLGLADVLGEPIAPADLADPERWSLHAEAFRARVGPFSALETLAHRRGQADAIRAEELVVNVGHHPHCASPPMPPAREVEELRRVSVQPVGMPCLLWWTVDLYVTEDGEIAAVSLDLYEP